MAKPTNLTSLNQHLTIQYNSHARVGALYMRALIFWQYTAEAADIADTANPGTERARWSRGRRSARGFNLIHEPESLARALGVARSVCAGDLNKQITTMR
jgi:hypothetical protein